jgi:hypothetical protein
MFKILGVFETKELGKPGQKPVARRFRAWLFCGVNVYLSDLLVTSNIIGESQNHPHSSSSRTS